MTTDAIYEEYRSDWSHQVSAVVATQLQHDKTLPLCEGCGLRDQPWEWPQQLELAQVDLMVIREDPKLHTKMFCEVMVQKQSETEWCAWQMRYEL